MFDKIIGKIQYLFKSDDQEVELSTPMEAIAEFELSYKNILIGSLKLNNGLWSFTYSNEFKEQNSISAIVDFPDKNKIYKSSALFPFFASRIPSLQRLKIQKVVSENITKDEVSLLKMFGKQSIANPYQLIAHN
jgi:HipA-like protein